MIFTITLNPAVDKAVVVDELVIGDANRVKQSRTDPSGKGVNVSRVIRELDGESVAMGFVAGSLGRFIEASLNEIGIRDDFLHIPGQTRTNFAIIEERTHRHTLINEPGPSVAPGAVDELKRRIRRAAKPGDWVVFAGSLPPGIPRDTYQHLIDMVHHLGGHTVLDADRDALRHGITAKPTLIKPNRREFLRLVGHEVQDDREILDAARQIQSEGITYVVVSLGASGAIAVTQGEAWRVIPPLVQEVSSVGSGDSMVGGMVLALSRGESFVDALRLGTAAGAATALTPGTELCRREDVERFLPEVQIEALH